MKLTVASGVVGAIIILFTQTIQAANVEPQRKTYVDSADPSAPTITESPLNSMLEVDLEKRQSGNDFVGYRASSTYWYWQTCASGQIYVTHSTWAACCDADATTCNYPTACLPGGRVLYNQGESNCNPGSICDAITVVQATDWLDDARTMIWCFTSTEPVTNTWYQVTYPLTTSTRTVTASATTLTETVTQTSEGDYGSNVQGPGSVVLIGFSFVAALLGLA
ncbi:hypothetical protein BJX64DRAFT_166072 [Aspergillus heterothallicus]